MVEQPEPARLNRSKESTELTRGEAKASPKKEQTREIETTTMFLVRTEANEAGC